jgi:DNA-binding response OmpR family regulator
MLEGIRVLLVEDHADMQRRYANALEARGATVTVAGSIQEAWGLFAWVAPNIVISEISLVDGDGFGFVRALHALEPERGGIVPVIALTASTREEDRERALEAGFDEHRTKRADIEEVVATVACLVGRGDDRLLRKPA